MEVGDSWVFRGFSSREGTDTFREEIVGSGEDHFLLSHVSDKGGDDRVFTILQSEAYPQMKLIEGLEFPLHVGKKWSLSYQARSVNNVRWSYKNKYKVQKIETKSVKAGRFKSFKIRLTTKRVGERPGD